MKKRNEWDIEDAGQTSKKERLRSVEHVLDSPALILFSLSIHFRSQLCGIRRRVISKKSRMRGLDQVQLFLAVPERDWLMLTTPLRNRHILQIA